MPLTRQRKKETEVVVKKEQGKKGRRKRKLSAADENVPVIKEIKQEPDIDVKQEGNQDVYQEESNRSRRTETSTQCPCCTDNSNTTDVHKTNTSKNHNRTRVSIRPSPNVDVQANSHKKRKINRRSAPPLITDPSTSRQADVILSDKMYSQQAPVTEDTKGDSSSDDESSDSDLNINLLQQDHTQGLFEGITGQPAYIEPISTPITDTIPKSIVKKIWANKFIDLGSLLSSNEPQEPRFVLQLDNNSQLHFVSQREPCKITSIEDWTSAFIRFTALYVEKFPHESANLMKYMEIVRDLAKRQCSFLYYDTNFRLLRSSIPIPWEQIHTEFWLLASTPPAPITSQQPFRKPAKFLANTCWTFNRRSQCHKPNCPHQHVCGYCRGPHHAGICSLF